jgi:hypothetical protein
MTPKRIDKASIKSTGTDRNDNVGIKSFPAPPPLAAPTDLKPPEVQTLTEVVSSIAVWQTQPEAEETSVTVDEVERADKAILLVDDRRGHSLEARIQADLTGSPSDLLG